MSVIELKNVSKIFGFADATTVALDDVNLTVDEGEFIVVIGPSGSGKSTLMNVIGLLDQVTHGSYRLDDQPVAELSNRSKAKVRRKQLGFIFQSPSLLSSMTVIDNVALPLVYAGVRRSKRHQLAFDLLQEFDIDQRAYYFPPQLSGGQAQSAAIARALINKPAIILADEPTGNLDSRSTSIIMKTFKRLHDDGHTIIMVTHNLELVRYADRVVSMLDGRISNDNVDLSTLILPKTNDDKEIKHASK